MGDEFDLDGSFSTNLYDGVCSEERLEHIAMRKFTRQILDHTGAFTLFTLYPSARSLRCACPYLRH